MSAIASFRHLWALRSFEAAARLLSFRRAAEELNLTPSAVSHQIKRLELELDQALFVRAQRSIRLTAAGQTLQKYTARGFLELSSGLNAVAHASNLTELRVSVAPTFAARYLISRVTRFERDNPTLRLNLDVTQSLVDFDEEKFDAAVRLSHRDHPELHSEVLMKVTVGLVCSPVLASKIRSIDDLSDITRIIVTQASNDWDTWYRAIGQEPVKPKRKVHFSPMIDGIQAAIDGIGVVIAPIPIVERHLLDGRLAMPFEQTFESQSSYLLLCRKGEESSRRIGRLRSWVRLAMQEESVDIGR